MRFRFLAIDIDGTLIRPDQTVAPDVVNAIADAETAGLRVCLATGRSYVETRPIWQQLRLVGPHEPMVLIGGALVAEAATGRTLYSRPIDRLLACEYADALNELGYSALAIVDVWRWGVDYFVAQGRDVEAIQRDWFAKMNVKVQSLTRFAEHPDLPPPLRINAIVASSDGQAVEAALTERFSSRLNMHSIFAPNYGVNIFEAFSAGTDKSTAVTYVSQAYRISPRDIVAVGDDINDVPMLKKAGLGVAMPDATAPARAAADLVADAGLAAFIRDLLAGKYD